MIPDRACKFTDAIKNWDVEVETIRAFAKQRPANMLEQLKSVFNLSGAQLSSYFDDSDGVLKGEFYLSDARCRVYLGQIKTDIGG